MKRTEYSYKKVVNAKGDCCLCFIPHMIFMKSIQATNKMLIKMDLNYFL